MSSHNRSSAGLSEETLETIRKFEKERRRQNRESNRSSRSTRLIDEIQQELLQNAEDEEQKRFLQNEIDMRAKMRRSSSISEEGILELCNVCYCDVLPKEMFSLGCGHRFCETCTEHHLTQLLDSGTAVKLTCMEQGCPAEFQEAEIAKFCSEKHLKIYKAILEDIEVGQNKKVKRCPTPDCNEVIKKPGCCCKRQGFCTACDNSMCFKCGAEWHSGKCEADSDWKNEQQMRFLLIANCIKCNAPISKNGACNHMTCSRCKAEFCWICRKDIKGHRWDQEQTDIKWTLGCSDLYGDTAKSWLCGMLCGLLILPFEAVYFASAKTGLFFHWLCFSGFNNFKRMTEDSPVIMTSLIGLYVLALPITVLIFAIIFPCLLVTRLFQALKMFFQNVLGACCLSCCSCCYD